MSERIVAGQSVQFDEEGFMVNPDDWNKDIAAELAREIGIDELTDRHWAVIDFSRSDYRDKGEAPTLRRITKAGGVATKELYLLFPKGPAKKVALVSGLGKPTGCI